MPLLRARALDPRSIVRGGGLRIALLAVGDREFLLQRPVFAAEASWMARTVLRVGRRVSEFPVDVALTGDVGALVAAAQVNGVGLSVVGGGAGTA